MTSSREVGILPVIAGAILLIVIAFFVSISYNNSEKTIVLQIGSGIYDTKIAADEASRQKGLSGASQLEADQALLMVFPESKKWDIWMKDMLVPIDIVWLDEDKVVVHIVTNAQPPDGEPKTFSPKKMAKYVIELPSGSVKSKSINIGNSAIFEVNSVIGVK